MAGYRQFVIEIIVISLLPTKLSQSQGKRLVGKIDITIISMTNCLYPAIQGVEFCVLPKNSY
jgi:hypothetical protein